MMNGAFFVKRMTALAAACAAVSVCTLSVYAEEKEPDFVVTVKAPPHIVFLGDSIVTGYGLEGYSSSDKSACASFANILSKVYGSELPPQADFTMDNFAVDGLTSKGLLEMLRSGELDEKLKNADAVVVSIGGNDMLHTFMQVFKKDDSIATMVGGILDLGKDLDRDLDGFAENMPEIAAELDDRTEGRIFVQTLYNPLEDTPISKLNSMSVEKIGRLNDTISECSDNGEKYVVADVAEQFVGRSKELTNIEDYDIHPNAQGHALIADILYSATTEYSYTYYDAEAAMQYELDQTEKRLKEAEDKECRTRNIAIGSGVGAAALLSVGAVLAVRRKKSR